MADKGAAMQKDLAANDDVTTHQAICCCIPNNLLSRQ